MQNAVVHFEIPFDDEKRARSFYEKAFGWKTQDWPLDDRSNYVGVMSCEVGDDRKPLEKGQLNGGMVPRSVVQTPALTVLAEDAEALAAKAIEAGGTRISKHSYVNVGTLIYIKDTEENLVGIWEEANKEDK